MQGSYQIEIRDHPLEDCRILGAICSVPGIPDNLFYFFLGYPSQLDKRLQSYRLRGRRCGVFA